MPAQCCKDFFARIPDDEPTFTIAGRDLLAFKTVENWIRLAEIHGIPQEKIEKARLHLTAISRFQVDHSDRCKLPD